jgi:hypothetical protein
MAWRMGLEYLSQLEYLSRAETTVGEWGDPIDMHTCQ